MTFNEKKTTQAAARFLTLAGKHMNYLKPSNSCTSWIGPRSSDGQGPSQVPSTTR